MEVKPPLSFGNCYHVYNRGNNSAPIFFEPENYYYFLRLYAKYIHPIADTYAWCLLKNHFHFLIKIKAAADIDVTQFTYSKHDKPKTIDASRQFSHLFNAYTQSINKRYHRTGSLFESRFERKLVDNQQYFNNLIYYIHHNPVHHGITHNTLLYPWSSYGTIISDQPTLLNRQAVLEAYGSKAAFVAYHEQEQDLSGIADWVIE